MYRERPVRKRSVFHQPEEEPVETFIRPTRRLSRTRDGTSKNTRRTLSSSRRPSVTRSRRRQQEPGHLGPGRRSWAAMVSWANPLIFPTLLCIISLVALQFFREDPLQLPLEETVHSGWKEPLQSAVEERPAIQSSWEGPFDLALRKARSALIGIRMGKSATTSLPSPFVPSEQPTITVTVEPKARSEQSSSVTVRIGKFDTPSLPTLFVTSEQPDIAATINPGATSEQIIPLGVRTSSSTTTPEPSLIVTSQELTNTLTTKQISASPLVAASQSFNTPLPTVAEPPVVVSQLDDDGFCDPFPPLPGTSYLLGEDPSGVFAMIDLFPKGTGAQLGNILSVWNTMTYEARLLRSHTKTWRDEISEITLNGQVSQYLSAQQLSHDEIKKIWRGYRMFLGQLIPDAALLESIIERDAGKCSSGTYRQANRLHSWLPNLFKPSPLGQMKARFKDFAVAQLTPIQQLVRQTQDALMALELAEIRKKHLVKKFKIAWKEWAQECTESKNYFTTGKVDVLRNKPVLCSSFQAEEARELIRQDSRPAFTVAISELQAFLRSVRILECRYKAMLGDPHDRTETEEERFETYEGYRRSLFEIKENMESAISLFNSIGDVTE